ncbi:MAG: HAMP domain-containing protein [Ardenticatenaceae bacterium]|nr:HAMP domain-containing protein [Ardenticatenaceae bacterium]
MSLIFWKRWPLALKLTVTITGIVVLLVLLVTAISTQRERHNFQAELEQQALLLLDTIAASTVDSLYFLDGDFMVDLMRDIGRAEVLTFGRIYDADGRIVADVLNPNAGFSLEPDALGQELVGRETAVFQWQADQLVAGQPVKVGAETIGAISIGLSTQPLAAKIDAVRNQGILVAVVAILVGLVLALLFSRSITEPLQLLMEATDRVSRGELSHRVHLASGDELAKLGGHFNRMTAQLAQTLQQMEQEIEQRKQTQAALEIAKNEAEAANRAKSTFLANVSHELRTPLAAIIGYSELIQEQVEFEEYDDLDRKAERILTSGTQLLRLINDILDLSKIEAGRMDVHLEPFSLAPFVDDVLMTTEPLMLKNGNQLKLVGDSSAWGEIVADEARLRQVLINLLGNAAKFTENGTITLRVERDGQAAMGEWIRLSVSDTGIGIPEEHVKLLFQPFSQVDPSTTRRYEGTGLGLAISQHFCEMMGGYIDVKSEEGLGSTFTVNLPIQAEPESSLMDV